MDHQSQSYLTEPLPICLTIVVAHLKTASKFIINVTLQKYKPTEECTLCSKNVLESCLIYLVLRKQFFSTFSRLE